MSEVRCLTMHIVRNHYGTILKWSGKTGKLRELQEVDNEYVLIFMQGDQCNRKKAVSFILIFSVKLSSG